MLRSALHDTDINFIKTEPSTHATPQISVFHLAKTMKPIHEYVIPVKANSPVDTGECFLILHGSLNKLQVAGAWCVTTFTQYSE